MFPDPTLKWQPYPSEMDGIMAPPWVFDQGYWRGVLHLIVLESKPGLRAYGVRIACEIHGGFDEMIYSVAEHGDEGGAYDGGVFVKEAARSRLIEDYAKADPANRRPRHFCFIGSDLCYETLGFSEPIVRAFANPDEAYEWGPARSGA